MVQTMWVFAQSHMCNSMLHIPYLGDTIPTASNTRFLVHVKREYSLHLLVLNADKFADGSEEVQIDSDDLILR